MEILIIDRQDYPIDEDALRSLSLHVLKREGASAGTELSILLVSEEEMARLNQKYLGKEGPTDVLSFPMDEREDENGIRMLGDVVICPDEVIRRKNNYGVAEGEEIALVLIHGILHLLGYEDKFETDNERMDRRQRELLSEWRG